MTQNLSKYNPFNRGKGKMAAEFMLEGWDNRKIYDYIKQNQLDSRFKTPLSKDFLYRTRYKLRRDGVFEKLERYKRAKEEAEEGTEAETDLPDGARAETEETPRSWPVHMKNDILIQEPIGSLMITQYIIIQEERLHRCLSKTIYALGKGYRKILKMTI